ncbi:cholecystokinin receptor-like [Lytechinus variegatus]|uniref:cholecystokinin receptor-like n=1 Tax=Lytechinus variegatus TaxID=7654 RepID=UPI001BB1D720|nr:cholecystokinin receptor-like [Lytechinus variegatus]
MDMVFLRSVKMEVFGTTSTGSETVAPGRDADILEEETVIKDANTRDNSLVFDRNDHSLTSPVTSFPKLPDEGHGDGVPGNVVITRAYTWKKRKTSTDILIIGQAVVDLFASTFAPVGNVLLIVLERNADLFCRIAALGLFLKEMYALASLLLTSAISIDRYMAVCRPLRRRITVRASCFIVAVCILVSIVTNIPFVTFSEIRDKTLNGSTTCASLVPSYVHFSFEVLHLSSFFLSFVTISVMYGLVYHSLRKRAKIHADLVNNRHGLPTVSQDVGIRTFSTGRATEPPGRDIDILVEETVMKRANTRDNAHDVFDRNDHSRTSTVTPFPEIADEGHDDGERFFLNARNTNLLSSPPLGLSLQQPIPVAAPRKPIKNKYYSDHGRKTTRMLLIITAFFFVTWTPKLIIPHLPGLGLLFECGTSIVINILLDLVFLNHIVNFFVYYLVNNSFRNDVKESFKFYRFDE